MGSDNEEKAETSFDVPGEISGELPVEISCEEPKNHFEPMSID
tara:strand:+ start:896 stop:1024 length:129 start_codon:yes stop_codon:yes gene_type:complete